MRKYIARFILIIYILMLSLIFIIPFRYKKGDTNLDNRINALDCIIINNIINDNTQYNLAQISNADIDCNGKIVLKDIQILSNQIIQQTNNQLGRKGEK